MGSEMLFVNFNQDFTCLSVGSRHGYKIYNCEPFGKYFMKRFDPVKLCSNLAADGAIAICEMLFQTSLVALVGIGDEPTMSPRKLQITNTKVFSPVTRIWRRAEEIATPGDLRVDVSDICACRQVEPKATYCCPGGTSIHLRHCNNETCLHH